METNHIRGKYLMVLIAMCGLAGSSVGMVINSAGVFYTAIAESFSVGRGAVSLTLTISTIAAAVSGLIAPKVMSDETKKFIIPLGAILMVGGTLGLSLANNVYFLYLMNVIRGFGSGFIHFVTITLFLNNWFQEKHGFVTSVAMGFSGIVGAILSPVLTSIISASGWRFAYIIMGILMFIFLCPALFFPFTFTPQASGLLPFGAKEFSNREAQKMENQTTVSNTTRAFILCAIVGICINFVIGLASHLPSYAQANGYSAEIGALMLSLALVFNIVSKILVGSLSDKIGPRNAVLFIAALDVLSFVLLLSNAGAWAMYGGSFLFGAGYGIAAVGIAMMAKYLFPATAFGSNYSLISFLGTLANALAPTIIGLLYDATGGYHLIMMIDIVLIVIVMICVTLSFQKKKA